MFFAPLEKVRGKPYLFILHICLQPCPLAVISRGTTRAMLICSGVLLPTQAASIQGSLASALLTRLNFVSPPDPHSTGKPRSLRRVNNVHRVAFTAAASFNGAFA